MSVPLLSLEGLSKYYINGQTVVVGLNHIDLSFSAGEFVAITGESGSGKSTLAHILAGVLQYEDGELRLSGRPTSHYDSADWERYRRDQISLISQSYGILPGATVETNVLSALRLTGMDKAQAAQEAEKILKKVELWDMRKRRAAKLSSGQKQRLSIARAFAKPAPILIADEPTGNLDPENSAKIIDLLADAAKERLVILITHEFSEAAEHATRHINLQDGRISMDAALREPNRVEDPPLRPSVKKAEKKSLSGYVARLQLRSRPVWCALVLLFFTLTAFAVFSFLGTFIVALDDTSTRIYDSSAFNNGDQRRIVIVRSDGAPMTQADYDTILSISNVEALERYGYVADIHLAWRENVDYKLHYSLNNVGTTLDPIYVSVSSAQVYDCASYVQTVPLFADGRTFLTDGRLPENFYEVVLAGDSSLIGQQMNIYLRNSKLWGYGDYVELPVTVVGVTNYGSGVYCHDDVARTLTSEMLYPDDNRLIQPLLIPWGEDVERDLSIATVALVFDPETSSFDTHTDVAPEDQDAVRPLCDHECLISKQYLLTAGTSAGYTYFFDVNNADLSKDRLSTTDYGLFSTANISTKLSYMNAFMVSPAAFDKYTLAGMGDQVSITVTDYGYSQRIMDALGKLGYLCVSPYIQGSTEIDPELAAERMQTLTVCIAALIAIVGLQLIVLRALFGMQTESYKLLSNIGLTCKTANGSVFLQILVFTLCGQLLGLGGILVCSAAGVSKIRHLINYLPVSYALILSLVHLAVSMLSGLLITRQLKKQVYPMSSRQADLDLGTDEEVLV